jgi:hypothetical protein
VAVADGQNEEMDPDVGCILVARILLDSSWAPEVLDLDNLVDMDFPVFVLETELHHGIVVAMRQEVEDEEHSVGDYHPQLYRLSLVKMTSEMRAQ